ncbi:acyltransferase family protein [Ornithinimicrobium sp. Y1694]|uniref:acyltransferase family protein n=1 Tax=Ornithinimicrobium sp. Y1694 TaxID=3418590 RepID=UPI003CF18FC4
MSVPARDATPGPELDPQGFVDAPPTSPTYAPRRPTHGRGDTAYGDGQRGTTDLLEPTRTAGPQRRRGGRGGRGPTGVAPRPGYIPGLDGLRAIAIAAVLVFHYMPAWLPGGYLGVDVFFVVSGFLITTLLLREIDSKGRIDLLGFWRRRARRLLPALLLVVLVSVSAARAIGGDLLVGIGRQTLGALTFTTNWLEIAAGASYFHATSPILFINFWSLAVEEQFYLLWPLSLVVALAVTRTTRQRVSAVATIGLVSAILMATLYDGGDATRVYYGTDTHLMGLMAGAAFALAWADPTHRAGLRSRAWRRYRGYAVLLAVVGLFALMMWMDESSALTFRGGILLASLLTVVLVAAALEADGPWRRIMELRPLRWLGERSYGVYLWHWPVLVIMGALVPYATGTVRGALVLSAALVLTFAFAELSLRLVERPVRRHGIRASVRRLTRWVTTPWNVSRTPRIVAAAVVLMLIATVVAIATAPEKSETQRQIEATESRLAGDGQAPAAGATDAGAEDAASEGAAGAAIGEELGLAGGDAQGSSSTSEGDEKDAKDDGAKDDDAKNDKSDTKDETSDTKDSTKDGVAADGTSAVVNGVEFTADADGYLVPSGDALTAIGDSLVVTSSDGLSYRFPGINYIAKSNRQWGDADALIEAGVADGTIRQDVVLHFGTNAGVDEKALRSALDTLGPDRNVVVMNLFVRASFTDSSNATLENVVADYDNVVLGDWAGTISQQPGVLQADKVHPDLEGMHVYAEVVAEAFDELARRD